MNKKIALLSTGNEIVNGDILNTNSQQIAQGLFSNGIKIGLHMVASDTQTDIEKSLTFLLQEHDAVILTGGLGPTSDDRTRFALAKVLDQKLIFNDLSWQHIQQRFAQIKLKHQPKSNKQQCLFPGNAEIFHNHNGTADACYVDFQGKAIFMLPGPPKECLPVFEKYVMPKLQLLKFPSNVYHQNWLLLGVSEGEIAERLDEIADDFAVTTGYRAQMPYVEFKVHAESQAEIDNFYQQAKSVIGSQQVNPQNIVASDLLCQTLISKKYNISINDQATKGLYLSHILSPKTLSYLHTDHEDSEHCFFIEGLDEIWHASDNTETLLKINNTEIMLANRGMRTLQLAFEHISKTILETIG